MSGLQGFHIWVPMFTICLILWGLSVYQDYRHIYYDAPHRITIPEERFPSVVSEDPCLLHGVFWCERLVHEYGATIGGEKIVSHRSLSDPCPLRDWTCRNARDIGAPSPQAEIYYDDRDPVTTLSRTIKSSRLSDSKWALLLGALGFVVGASLLGLMWLVMLDDCCFSRH